MRNAADSFVNVGMFCDSGALCEIDRMLRSYANHRISKEQLNNYFKQQGVVGVVGLTEVSSLFAADAIAEGVAARRFVMWWERAAQTDTTLGRLLYKFGNNRYVRVGVSRWGGRRVFRISGKLLEKIPRWARRILKVKETSKGFKIDLLDLGPQ